MTQKLFLFIFSFITLIALPALPAIPAVDSGEIVIDQWLALGPMPIPNTEIELLGNEKNILKFNHVAIHSLKPSIDETIEWPGELQFTWKPIQSVSFQTSSHQVLYLATYLETHRWLQTDIFIRNVDNPFILYLDGEAQKTSKTEDGDAWKSELTLTNGSHRLIIKVLLKKDKPLASTIVLQNKDAFSQDPIEVSTNSIGLLDTSHILNTRRVSRLKLSPDGSKVAVSISYTSPRDGKNKKWLEILSVATGTCVFSSRSSGDMQDFSWLKDSRHFSYTSTSKGKTNLFRYDISTHEQEKMLSDIVNFNSYTWAPDNSYLIYTVYSKKEDNGIYRHIEEIDDRASFARYQYAMYLFYPQGKVTHKIGDKDRNYSIAAISPDNKHALLIKTVEDAQNRPYNKTIVYLLNTIDLSGRELLNHRFIGPITWSPDSNHLLILGGPSAFDGIGKTIPENVTPNDYDNQAFLYDISTGDVRPISREFRPSIESAYWHQQDNALFFKVTEKANGNLYRFSTKTENYLRLDTLVDSIQFISFAQDQNIAVYWGSGVSNPDKLYKIDLKKRNASLLKDYNRDLFENIRLGQVKDWNFTTEDGKTITGRIYFPPDFDIDKKYPCIVNYYGGTSPVRRSFGGRYPRNWYASQGYIVYVLQPTGTVGFGQENSSIHVNDWGQVTTQQIIAGIKQLTAAHPFIDPNRIGAIGASYGGFLTQYLAANTDLVSAFVSHAGISALSSYWGVGDWGYSYSAIATAESFPWNRKDIYVERSPLFMANRITKPLLLLHGSADNNVPPGESYQMYTALKLLGKEVELITFNDEKHWILDYEKRLHWMRTIIAWFDKWLKGQPEHWDHLYGSAEH